MWLFEGPVGCEPEFPKDFVGDREGEVSASTIVVDRLATRKLCPAGAARLRI